MTDYRFRTAPIVLADIIPSGDNALVFGMAPDGLTKPAGGAPGLIPHRRGA
jgi:hypothetical protein